MTTLAARRMGCRFTEKLTSNITEGVRLSSILLPLAQPHTCALHPVPEGLGLCLSVPLPPQEELVPPEQPPATLLRVSLLVVEVVVTVETAELRQMLPEDLFYRKPRDQVHWQSRKTYRSNSIQLDYK